jgi:hypothetical protein
MKEIIPKIDTAILMKELTADRFVRYTNFGGNEIYMVNSKNAPNVMLEIGRLREITFRAAGGGTGKETDIDDYDLGDNSFEQLLVWNPADKAIMGGYRFIHCKNLKFNDDGTVKTPTSKLFSYSEKFIRDYLPKTIELGRSFVQPEYQPTKNMRKGLYSLDNLWDGLGAIVVANPDVEYLFGKITMYRNTDLLAREAIMYFLNRFFPDPEKLVRPHHPVEITTDTEVFERHFTGRTYDENYKLLQQFVRKRGQQIPPLVNAYMNLSSSMKTFGTALNQNFGDVEETGIMIAIADIYPEKKDRHIKNIRR